ncbi:2-deoxyglucose-6-phosphate phosphatase [Clostridium liquoris]|jgi:HAD superfamily hydrolase (TIGR01509 family)|uniref:2-deoxyglucose-6-phosphate phosphatase n=1 Tax=Clostridium liquoris TaxID=1289519 RepID=A0A2T0B3F2_9CLOT|nr:HAD family phosphatase [Clostridium liquoris]PRR78402.1 2-deoxyglucose-6-phosphate phosphatase [Clostridium liquoris]
MFKDIKAAIFDMDGTLIDSMWVWKTVDIEYLMKRNITPPDDLRENIEHLSFSETAKYFKERFNLNESIEAIIAEWNDIALKEYTNNVKLKPGAKEFLTLLKSNEIKIGLATSNCDMLLEVALKNNNIYDYFDCITTTNEVNRGKNFPDVYLLCAEKLEVAPTKCIVFEDILPAVIGAKAAGMKVIGVHDLYSENQKEDIMRLADLYIFQYNELTKAV